MRLERLTLCLEFADIREGKVREVLVRLPEEAVFPLRTDISPCLIACDVGTAFGYF